MDTGEGRFDRFETMEELEAERKRLVTAGKRVGGTFYIGQELEIKGSRFKVSKIIRDGLKLKLLPLLPTGAGKE